MVCQEALGHIYFVRGGETARELLPRVVQQHTGYFLKAPD